MNFAGPIANLSSPTIPGMPHNFWENIGLVVYLPDVSQNPVYRRCFGQAADKNCFDMMNAPGAGVAWGSAERVEETERG